MFTKKASAISTDSPPVNGHSNHYPLPSSNSAAAVIQETTNSPLASQLSTNTPPPKYYPLATKLKCRNDFISGKGKLPELASKYGINLMTMQSWSCADKWTRRRKQYMQRAAARFEAQGETPNDDAPLPANPNDTNGRIREVEGQIQQIATAMREAKSGRELRDLAMAQKLVLDSWSLLTGHPRPGTRRQARKGGSSRQSSDFGPVDDQEGQNAGGS